MPEAVNPKRVVRDHLDGIQADRCFSIYLSDYDNSVKHAGLSQEPTHEKPAERAAGLTVREIVELFRDTLDKERLRTDQLADEALELKLMLDLRGRGLSQLPKEVIPIIRNDVERLQLARNSLSHIGIEFTQCTALKYLNLRNNAFAEIPQAIFGLPQLEILDFSSNQLREIPNEIGSLKALRLLSVQHNQIRDLPSVLTTIGTLRMLKVAGNPLNPQLHPVTALSPSLSDMKDDNAREFIITRKLLEFMKANSATRDSGEDSTDDGPLETPRALYSRFPVQSPYGPQYGHSTSGSESASDLRSPGIVKPSISMRSHTRAPSNHYNALQMAAPRRPGLAPLALGNERNRSNSESILQYTHNNRLKRNGLMIGNKQNDLRVVDESRTRRDSHHFRGQSHGSALRNGVRAGDSSPSVSPNGGDIQRGMATRRLASLPTQKRESKSTDQVVESSKGVLYSANMMNPMASTLASVIKDGKSRRSSVERDFHTAMMQMEHLDQELLRLDNIANQDGTIARQYRKKVIMATRDCVAVQQRLTTLLARTARQLVKDCDHRYIRTFMLTCYGSMTEMINATQSLRIDALKSKPTKANVHRVSTINEGISEGEHTYKSDRSMTPTQRRKPDRRLRVHGITQQSVSHTNLSPGGAPTAVPLYANGRSRSNSRVGAFHSSASSSVMNTPRSGESFSSANLVARSRSGSVNVAIGQSSAEQAEIAQFEEIFSNLSRSVGEGSRIVPQLHEIINNLDAAERSNAHDEGFGVHRPWARLALSTMDCLRFTEALRMSLSDVRLNDREARNFRGFWQLSKSFLDSYTNLFGAVKDAIGKKLLEPRIRVQLKPAHLAIKTTSELINRSQWKPLMENVDPQATPHAAPQVYTQMPVQNGYQHRTRGSAGSSAGGTSPYPGNVPATPLSAALGPAAQATVPANLPTSAGAIPPTPGTANLERSFEGDIFQRADTYAAMQATMVPRRPGL